MSPKPETLEARQCGLCREAEKQPRRRQSFLSQGCQSQQAESLAGAAAIARAVHRIIERRTACGLLAAAVEKAKALFGDEWAIAYNAPSVQTQCHVHLHIGKLIPGVETEPVLHRDEDRRYPGASQRRRVLDSPAGQSVPRPHRRTSYRNGSRKVAKKKGKQWVCSKSPSFRRRKMPSIHLHPSDNIAIARVALSPGQTAAGGGKHHHCGGSDSGGSQSRSARPFRPESTLCAMDR